MIHLGVKSDPVQYRYSYEWLFDLMQAHDVRYLQLGSFFELYTLEDGFFHDLRNQAERRNIRIKSCFTAHRELGGFLTGDMYFEKAARKNYERYLQVGGLLGVDYLGANLGAVYRDRMETKAEGIDRYIRHMQELVMIARYYGIKALTVEPMSCTAEPPSFPDEILTLMQTFEAYHAEHPTTTVPLYLCGDIGHGIADTQGQILHGNLELFEIGIPYMAEFHLKNTDALFNSTFGFSPPEMERGIIDLTQIRTLLDAYADRWPVDEVVGYLELSGPKFGRDYSDTTLEQALSASLTALKAAFA
ncbi:hypothetical protein GF339_02640 [candidate division KSB3 bacterium]|uniref:Xylose isomerase-like TIM barrel domain-containing protein n=1 Tax=candidate division KSB3 bacterium TaxID=2044937 RepID=A0A9D5JT20_9BACT|nr:hypothetical protein [candidate division KSB3 bacterium]MBD3323452.1 hypothetical protein [candidate division KSB3 bacterium]